MLQGEFIHLPRIAKRIKLLKNVMILKSNLSVYSLNNVEHHSNHIISYLAKSKKHTLVEERIGSPILSSEEDSPKAIPETISLKDSQKVKNDGNSKSLEIPIDRIYSDSEEEREYQVIFYSFVFIYVNFCIKIIIIII